jgi:hypothetical protein
MIDANEVIGSEEDMGIEVLIKECNWVDMYKVFHQDNTEIATHINGSKTINFLLATPNTVKYINKIGYTKFHECLDSGHRGIFCDLSKDIINNIQVTKKIRLIGTNSTNEEGKRYIKHLYQHLLNNNLFNKSEELLKRAKDGVHNRTQEIPILEKMDDLITKAMLKAEHDTCKKKDLVL